MRKFLLLPLLIAVGISAFAQTNLKTIRQKSWQVIIHKIPADTAEKYLVNYKIYPSHYLNETPFAIALKDTFDYELLPVGNYLVFSAEDNELLVNYYCRTNLLVMPINNQHRVQLEVRNREGVYFDNAAVWVNKKKANYYEQSKTWSIKDKFPDEAIIKVAVAGDTLFAELAAKEDIHESIAHQQWRKFSSTKIGRFIAWPYNKISYMISHPARDWFRKKHRYKYIPERGYMLFNKPIYKPGDTLKLKGYLVNKHLRQYKQPLQLVLNYNDNGNRVSKELKLLKPVTPGAFVHEFVLGDTLDSDVTYTLELRNEKNKKVLSRNFRIEDYLLDEVSTYNLRSQKENYYAADTLQFFASAKDANGLSIMDGRVKFFLLTNGIHKWYDEKLYVPDTLWQEEKKLSIDADTRFEIPAGKLPKASMQLKAMAVFINSNNETQEQTEEVDYEPESAVIDVTQKADSIFAVFFLNGKQTTATGTVAKSFDDNDIPIKYPYAAKVDAYTESYYFFADDVNGKTIANNNYQIRDNYRIDFSRLQQEDTTGFVLFNPRRIPVHFTVFYGNNILSSGSGSDEVIVWKDKLVKGRAYRVEWQYIWAGQERKGDETIAVMDKLASIKINGNQTVFPGMKDTITLKALDYKNRPLQNMNITAVSYNSQFAKDIYVKEPPFLHSFHQPRRIIRDNFELEIAEFKNNFNLGDYREWNNKLGADTMQYYQLLFPANGMQVIKNYIRDFTPQVSVFAVDNGVPQEIYTLSINKELAYYNGTTDKGVYSFAVYPGYMQLGIRLKDKYVELDSIYVQPNYKHDIFIDVKNLPPHSSVTNKPDYWTAGERNELENNLWQLASDYRTNNGYVWQNEKLFYLGANQKHIVGPFRKFGELQFFKPGSFDFKFEFEPGYEYSLKPAAARLEKKTVFPSFLAEVKLPDVKKTVWQMGDTIIPPPAINYKNELAPGFYDGYGFDYFNAKPGYGKFIIDYPADSVWSYTIIYPAGKPWKKKYRLDRTGIFSGLQPGTYELVLITNHNFVLQQKEIEIKADSTLCLKIQSRNYALYNSTLHYYLNTREPELPVTKEEKEIEPKAAIPVIEALRGNAMISGKVIDAKGKSPIAGASVYLKGYKTGTYADVNGNFSLKNIKEGNYTLIIASVGYAPKEFKIRLSDALPLTINVGLNASANHLDEVVVIGYGTSKRKDITGSVVSVSSQGLSQTLMGKVPGLYINGDSYMPRAVATVQIRGASSLGANNQPLFIVNGVPMEEMPAGLDTTGITVTILKEAAAVSLYGSRAANGVVIINSKDFVASSSLRDKFRDYAFWQPNLITDENGEAKFTVTYPDNITSWQTFAVGMDKKRRIAKSSVMVKSFKPLLAQLSLPQFLTEGDSVVFIGKKTNYTGEAFNTKEQFTLNNQKVFEREKNIPANSADTTELMVMATGVDSIVAKYSIEAGNGFADGELRKNPVIKKGTVEAVGKFWVLDKDTSVRFNAEPSAGKITLHAQNNTLDVLLDEIDYLKKYPYYCMEQTTSKLKGLVMEKKIREILKQKFTGDADIEKLKSKLQKAQLYNGGWAWWEAGEANLTITNYVLRGLLTMRGDALLETNIRNGLLYLQNQLPTLKKDELLSTLLTLSEANHLMNFEEYLSAIHFDSLTTHQQWQYVSIKQQQKMDYEKELNKLLKAKNETLMGGMYWGTDGWWWNRNIMATTVEAFKMLEKEANHPEELKHIARYFLERRDKGRYTNTVESASVLSAILPWMIKNKTDVTVVSSVTISGDTSINIQQFPSTVITSEKIKDLKVEKKGGGIVFFTAYQQVFNNNPQPVKDNFEVQTTFERRGTAVTSLKAGEKINLKVELKVLKDAEYVQIEVPIPAGCTYGEKKQDGWNTHKEFSKNKTMIFAEKLKAGTYTYIIELEPRYTGRFHLNPAKAELMYFPTFYGRNEMKKVEIVK